MEQLDSEMEPHYDYRMGHWGDSSSEGSEYVLGSAEESESESGSDADDFGESESGSDDDDAHSP